MPIDATPADSLDSQGPVVLSRPETGRPMISESGVRYGQWYGDPSSDSSDVELEEAVDGVRVSVWIQQNGVATGSDRGVLFLDGERLCFAGPCMSFALGAGDIQRSKRMPARFSGSAPCLWLKCRGRSVKLDFSPVPFNGYVEGKRLRDMVYFFHGNQTQSEERGQLPPLQVSPSIKKPVLKNRRPNVHSGIPTLVYAWLGFSAGFRWAWFMSALYALFFVWEIVDARRHRALLARLDAEIGEGPEKS